MKKIITVDSPARIHLGFLETNKNTDRKFGSIGLAISGFKNIFKIEFSKNKEIVCNNKILERKVHEIFEIFSKKKK